MKNLYKASILACASAITFNALHVTSCSAMDKKKLDSTILQQVVTAFGGNTFDVICYSAKKGNVNILKAIYDELQCIFAKNNSYHAIDCLWSFGCKLRTDYKDYFTRISQKSLWQTLKSISKKGNIETMEIFFLIIDKIFRVYSKDPRESVANYDKNLEECFNSATENNQKDIAYFLERKLKEIS